MAKAKEMLLIASKVKAYVKSKGCHTAGDMLPALNDKVYCILDAAAARTKGNKRSTVKPQDV